MKNLIAPMHSERERGQALVLLALAFVGLAAFIGLAVDAGILFANVGHLRRAVDSASLAAANQFREGRTPAQLSAMAEEFLELNGLEPLAATAFICDLDTPGSFYDDPDLCPGGNNPPDPLDGTPRKFVRVVAQLPVNFAFLPIIGWDSVSIEANAISEAASLDLVLVVDTSASMAFDLCHDNPPNNDQDGDGTPNDCGMTISGVPVVGDPEYLPALCNQNRLDRLSTGDAVTYPPENDCHPFEEVRAATKGLLSRMYFPYDRMALVTYASVGNVAVSLEDGTDCETLEDALGVNNVCLPTEPEPVGMQVSDEPGNPPCSFPPDPRGCANTNTAEGLTLAGNQFGLYIREEAVWVVILLSDGAANAYRIADVVTDPNSWLCPGSAGSPTWVQPFCRDPWSNTRHDSADSDYDTDDAARDAADFVGCPDAESFDPLLTDCTASGQGAVIFSIGLGDLMINSTACDGSYGGSCEADLGEKLLRYVAAVGDDGDPGTDACSTISAGNTCGNYYYSPTGSGLLKVFEAIASRIFTRITH